MYMFVLFFYIKNIQRSILVRCRLGKLAFFITTPRSLRSLTKTPKQLLSLRFHCFITAQTISQSLTSLLLKLSVICLQLVAHKTVNISYLIILQCISLYLSSVANSHKLYITKCKDLVQNCVSYVIIKRKRLPSRKDNKTQAHFSLITNN